MKARRGEHAAPYLGIVHLLRIRPHVPEHLFHVSLKDAEPLRRDGTAHEHQRIDGEERIATEIGDRVPFEEAFGLQVRVFGLVPDPGESFGGGPVSGEIRRGPRPRRRR